jgi:uncharacterized protein YkwD
MVSEVIMVHRFRHSGWLVALAILMGLLLMLMPAMQSHASGAAAQPSVCVTAEEQQLLTLINDARSQAGVGPLTMSEEFLAASLSQVKSMSDEGYFAYDSPDGTTWWENAQDHGAESEYRGENISYGFDAAGTFNQWWASAEHKDNMIDPNYTVAGIGMIIGPSPAGDGQVTTTWAAAFGDTLGTPAQPCAAPSTPTAVPPATSTPVHPVILTPVTPPATITPAVTATPSATPAPQPVDAPWCVAISNPNDSRWCADGTLNGDAVINGVPVTIIVDPVTHTVTVKVRQSPNG